MSKVNCVLLVKDRPRLTEQCLASLYKNTPDDQFNLVICDDGSSMEALHVVANYGRTKDNIRIIHLAPSIGIVGWLRNVGASASERYFGRGEWLYFSDNDLYYQAGWLEKMIACKENTKVAGGKGVAVLGGYRHPFHGSNMTVTNAGHSIDLADAVAGYSMLMRWETFDLYGPFDQHAKGVCQSEDFAICQKIVKAGGYVGYINPPVLINCGLTNSEGKPAIGHEHFRVNTLEPVIYE